MISILQFEIEHGIDALLNVYLAIKYDDFDFIERCLDRADSVYAADYATWVIEHEGT